MRRQSPLFGLPFSCDRVSRFFWQKNHLSEYVDVKILHALSLELTTRILILGDLMLRHYYILLSIVGLPLIVAGCAGPKAQSAASMAIPIRAASADLAVALIRTAGQGDEGSLVENPGWREYVIECVARAEKCRTCACGQGGTQCFPAECRAGQGAGRGLCPGRHDPSPRNPVATAGTITPRGISKFHFPLFYTETRPAGERFDHIRYPSVNARAQPASVANSRSTMTDQDGACPKSNNRMTSGVMTAA
jgi:hypothetical protein